MSFLARLSHHTLSQSRVVEAGETLQGAKRLATAEFEDEYQDYTIVIVDEETDEIVSQRRVSDKRWRDTPARQPGRPLKGDEKRERYNVMLEPRLRDRADEIGNGNFSAGVALAIESFPDNQTEQRK